MTHLVSGRLPPTFQPTSSRPPLITPERDPPSTPPPTKLSSTNAPTDRRNQIIYENYDTKYNVYDNEPDPKDEFEEDIPGGRNIAQASLAPTTILVIGIIGVAIVAIILISCIVLKTR